MIEGDGPVSHPARGPLDIRPARPDDLEAIVEIHNQAIRAGAIGFLEPHDVEERRAWLDGRPEKRPVLVAERDGAVVGWAELSDYRPGRRALRHAVEISYFVDAAQVRRGVGSALVRRCVELCPDLGIRDLVAILLEDNHASVGLLEKLGFTRRGHLPGIAVVEGREVGHLYYGLRVDPS